MKKVDYLVLGNGVAANSAIDTLRKKKKKASVLIIGDEDFEFYYRPQLPDYLLNRVSDDKIIKRKKSFYKNNNIELLKSKRVVKIIPQKKEVLLQDNKKVHYSKLLVATGLSPYKSPFSFQTLGDVKNLQKIIDRIKDVLITGEYIFVLELLRALTGKGKRVSYVCKGARLFENLLDERASWHLEQLLISQGVSLIYNTEIVKALLHADGKYLIQMSQGSKICVDIYFSADFDDKNKDMFLDAGISYAESGIWVNRNMETNKKGIYAAGDVARVKNGYPPNVLRVGWQRAKQQGEIAGLNMQGERKAFNPFATALHIRFGSINFLLAGEMPATSFGCGGDIILESTPDNYYKRVHIEDGVVKGFVFVGGTRGLARVKELLSEGIVLTKSEKFVLQRELEEGRGETISLQASCPTCKTILDLPMTVEIGKNIICEVCGADSVVSRTKVSKVKYLELI